MNVETVHREKMRNPGNLDALNMQSIAFQGQWYHAAKITFNSFARHLAALDDVHFVIPANQKRVVFFEKKRVLSGKELCILPCYSRSTNTV